MKLPVISIRVLQSAISRLERRWRVLLGLFRAASAISA